MLFSEEKPAHSHFDSGQKENCTSDEKSSFPLLLSEVPPSTRGCHISLPRGHKGTYFLTKPLNLSEHGGVLIRRQALEGKAKRSAFGTGVCCEVSQCVLVE